MKNNRFDEQDFEKGRELERDTSGHKKYVRYVEEIFNTTEFKKLISYLREKYAIPKNGFSSTQRIFPPESWIYGHTKLNFLLSKEIRAFCKKKGIHFLDSSMWIEEYLFYNDFDPKNMTFGDGTNNLLFVTDLKLEKEEPYGKDTQEDDNLLFPIAIRISPYASLRDIIDYVKKVYTFRIKPLQSQYRKNEIKIGELKKRKDSIKERDNFIYENRHLPKKSLLGLVTKKFGVKNMPDYAYIGKIISLEKKRRDTP